MVTGHAACRLRASARSLHPEGKPYSASAHLASVGRKLCNEGRCLFAQLLERSEMSLPDVELLTSIIQLVESCRTSSSSHSAGPEWSLCLPFADYLQAKRSFTGLPLRQVMCKLVTGLPEGQSTHTKSLRSGALLTVSRVQRVAN